MPLMTITERGQSGWQAFCMASNATRARRRLVTWLGGDIVTGMVEVPIVTQEALSWTLKWLEVPLSGESEVINSDEVARLHRDLIDRSAQETEVAVASATAAASVALQLKSGISPTEVDENEALCQQLCNLQLLVGPVNVQKQAAMPGDWLKAHYSDDAQRDMWLTTYDAQGIPDDIKDFRQFALKRRERMRKRLGEFLGVDLALTQDANHQEDPPQAVDEEAELLQSGTTS